jgi:hypothetical protein
LGVANPSIEPIHIPITPEETPYAQPLVGSGAEGLDAANLARRLAHQGPERAARTVFRLTQSELRPQIISVVNDLNTRDVSGSVPREQIQEMNQEFISVFEPLVVPVEEFCLASVEEGWNPGVKDVGFRFASDWITISKQSGSARDIRSVRGTPALLAWRLIILMGAKALEEPNFGLLNTILWEPIEVEESSGRFSHRPFFQQRDLFWPEAFLGYADLGIKYIVKIWQNHSHIRKFFDTEENYHTCVAQFLMIVALADAKINQDRPLYPVYPGYRLIPHANRAMARLCSRLAASANYRDRIGTAIGENSLLRDRWSREKWSALVSRANGAELGPRYSPGFGTHFPDSLDADVPDC